MNKDFDKSINEYMSSYKNIRCPLFENFVKQYKNEYKKMIQENNKLKKYAFHLKYKGKNVEESLLKNKTNELKEIINLYETYLHNILGEDRGWNTYNISTNNINEGLIMSYNYDVIFDKFVNETGVSDADIAFLDNENIETKEISIIIYLDEYNKLKDNINKFITKCGYFISIIDKNEILNIVELQIEPKYIVELTSSEPKFDLIYDKENDNIKNKCNGILYHMTLGAYYDKIKNIGLIPKAKNKKSVHPERIYFYQGNKLGNNISKNMFILQALLFYKPDGKYIDSVKPCLKNDKLEVVILKIDLYKYPSLKYRFFQDPNHLQGIFTYEPIHPVCVDLYTSFYI